MHSKTNFKKRINLPDVIFNFVQFGVILKVCFCLQLIAKHLVINN